MYGLPKASQSREFMPLDVQFYDINVPPAHFISPKIFKPNNIDGLLYIKVNVEVIKFPLGKAA